MPYLIGTDEAGYGPNLGPLVIGATVWRVPELNVDLYELLGDVVSPGVAVGKLAIADSKQLFHPGGGLAHLETGLFAGLESMGVRPRSWRDVWRSLASQANTRLAHLPWYRDYDTPLPLDAEDEDIATRAHQWQVACRKCDVALVGVRCRAVFPDEFNTVTDRLDSKGALLSQCTLQLVADLLGDLDDHVRISCDKHGGRNRYAPLLQEVFAESLFQVVCESRQESVYRWTAGRFSREISFVAKGESFLPSALASMAAKYLRELAMGAFNHFWQQHIPDLKPTAGYPQDARRFKAAIREAQQKLQIPDRILWRTR